jgi:hypothetical protein
VALTLTINGVDKTSLLKDGSLDVEKTGPTESCRLDILVKADNTASAYRPVVGDVMRLLHNAYLLMGGPIVRVEDRRLGGDSGTVTRITVRDWLFLAEQVIIEDRYFPPTPAYELFDDLVTTYLADKGVTNIGLSVAGPDLPELFVKGETLLSVFLQMTEQTGYPFRINGDKECALVEPGSLVWPGGGLTVSNITDGLTWTKDELIQANRLHLTTGTPEAGAGPITFFETHTADGTMTCFPVNVIPNRTLVGRIDNDPAGYSAGATSIALKDLTPGMVIVADNSLGQDGAATPCVVQSDVTVDEDGKATVVISPGLTTAADDNDPITFSNETGVQLFVNDVATDLFGSDWVWDRLQQAVVNPVTAPDADDEIKIQSRVTFPVVVRVWETSGVDVQDAQGNFDYGVIVDGTIEGTTHTDLPQAAAYARDVLTRRLEPPKIVRCTTFEQDWYPFLSTTVTWGARLLSSSYMVDSVRVRAIGIDPAATTLELPYELEMVEGDALRQSWVDYYRGTNPSRGIRWGGFLPEIAPPEFVQAQGDPSSVATSNATTLAVTPTVGNLLVVLLSRTYGAPGGSGGNVEPTIADNQAGGGNDYTHHLGTSTGYGTTAGGVIDIWTAPITVASGPFIITITTGYGEYMTTAVLEFENVNTAAPIHALVESSGSGTTHTADLADLSAPCYVVGAITAKFVGATVTADAAWPVLYFFGVNNTVTQGMNVVGKQAGPGAADPLWATSSGAFHVAAIAINGTVVA